jgi:hypothetical protein
MNRIISFLIDYGKLLYLTGVKMMEVDEAQDKIDSDKK